jgi:F0F1-type ATP synthase assembly protein I
MTADDYPQRVGEEPRDTGATSRGRAASGAGASGAELAGAGFQFAAAVLLCLFGGRWLDARLGTSPWLLILGTFVGAAVGFFAMYRTLMGSRARARRRTPRPSERSGE